MDSERRQTAELRALLSSSVQEKLTAEGERERLELEIQRLKEQLKWHQEQLSSTKEAPIRSQTPELPTAHVETRLNPVERSKDEYMDQVSGLHLRWQGYLICKKVHMWNHLVDWIKMSEIGVTGWRKTPSNIIVQSAAVNEQGTGSISNTEAAPDLWPACRWRPAQRGFPVQK